MATAEEQAHAARLLEIHTDNLRRLEEKKARLGIEAPTWIESQIEEEKANIAALEPIANPPPKPSQRIQEFVKQTTPGEIDLMMLYLQGVQSNARITKVEEKVETIVQSQGAAQLWRLDVSNRLEDSDRARVYGQKRNFRLSVASLALILLLVVAMWLILGRAGLL